MKARITEECVACGLCVDICPDVFEMGNQFAQVKADSNPDKFVKGLKPKISKLPQFKSGT
jgi:ferredoxin